MFLHHGCTCPNCAINLWYRDTVVVHNQRLTQVVPTPSGSYAFLETAELAQ